uniref:Uncharacterized protein n=1 Tax=Chlamydomonas leiostraca TaxID=1034604 RepID=A0A7S0X080_9CHLO|mmetsp:Transcript_4977/g.12217  ORF Transcript_4977/g.12217 Transcript_4977/m.12217 type:complete len:126 (+) Transcript_4977:100-477(+)
MKFELDNDKLLQANAAGAIAYGIGQAIPKSPLNDVTFTGGLGDGPSRHMAALSSAVGASCCISAKSSDSKTKKDMLKLCGVGWVACAGIHVLNWQQKHEKKDAAIGQAVAKAAFGGLNLYAGFKK